ncbi:transposable element Tc1 transposase [Trichonephila clavipes]|nr:transposable element Tc1 transposase [Trichonephila clavipes]
MSKSKELSGFDRGSVVGCHLWRKSVHEIADILQKPKSTVSGVIVKWKRRGNETVEKTNQVWQSDVYVWVWRMPGERFFSEYIVHIVKFCGGSIIVWWCFLGFGPSPLVPVIENMNSEMCMDILDNAALPTLWQYIEKGPFLLKQDNFSIHTSKLAQTWFDEMVVQKLDCPSQSPDLNPIEHLWDELERRLRSQPNRPSSLLALTSTVTDAWKAIPMVTYQKLMESLPKSVQVVIHAKRGPTSH